MTTKSSSSIVAAAVATTVAVWWWSRRQRRLDRDDEHDLQLYDTDKIYLDYNATTPIYREVYQAMLPFLGKHFGNPGSAHWAGRAPKQALQTARHQVLQLLDSTQCPLSTIWFTSCGTESDNLAIELALQSWTGKDVPHIVTSNIEHPAVSAYLQVLKDTHQCQVTTVACQENGRVEASDLIAAFDPDKTCLVTLMLANNESGALQPVREVAEYCRRHNVLFHTDAAQAAGKVSVCLADLGEPDMVTVVGHKMGAPKGVACLYVREGCLNAGNREMHSHSVLLVGGGQEHGRRGGTENVASIVGFGVAAALASKNLDKNQQHMEQLRSRLLAQLVKGLGQDRIRVNGPVDPNHRLPNTLSVGIKGVESSDLLAAVGDQVAASAGATCHSGTAKVSSVLQAMNVPMEFASGTIRLSVGPHTTNNQVDRATEILVQAAKQ